MSEQVCDRVGVRDPCTACCVGVCVQHTYGMGLQTELHRRRERERREGGKLSAPGVISVQQLTLFSVMLRSRDQPNTTCILV